MAQTYTTRYCLPAQTKRQVFAHASHLSFLAHKMKSQQMSLVNLPPRLTGHLPLSHFAILHIGIGIPLRRIGIDRFYQRNVQHWQANFGDTCTHVRAEQVDG